MKANHFEILVEEPSMEAFLIELLPRIMENRATFTIYVHQGKSDLLKKLESRLRAYAKWLPENARILVLIDRDNDDCVNLKQTLETFARNAGLTSRTANSEDWQVVNRIAIEELEAWFFGEWNGMRQAYPKLKANIVANASYRNCDEILGGTWESLERVFKKQGYFSGGLRKVELATEIGKHFNPQNCVSPSFATFHSALLEATEAT